MTRDVTSEVATQVGDPKGICRQSYDCLMYPQTTLTPHLTLILTTPRRKRPSQFPSHLRGQLVPSLFASLCAVSSLASHSSWSDFGAVGAGLLTCLRPCSPDGASSAAVAHVQVCVSPSLPCSVASVSLRTSQWAWFRM
jgi:hypothetical protein